MSGSKSASFSCGSKSGNKSGYSKTGSSKSKSSKTSSSNSSSSARTTGNVAFLEGSYRVVDDEVTWEGLWAFDASVLTGNGEGSITSRFSYVLDKHTTRYHGYFMLCCPPPAPPIRIEEHFSIEFSETANKGTYSMQGSGENVYGKFDLVGSLKRTTLRAEKVYAPIATEAQAFADIDTAKKCFECKVAHIRSRSHTVTRCRKQFGHTAVSWQLDPRWEQFVASKGAVVRPARKCPVASQVPAEHRGMSMECAQELQKRGFIDELQLKKLNKMILESDPALPAALDKYDEGDHEALVDLMRASPVNLLDLAWTEDRELGCGPFPQTDGAALPTSGSPISTAKSFDDFDDMDTAFSGARQAQIDLLHRDDMERADAESDITSDMEGFCDDMEG